MVPANGVLKHFTTYSTGIIPYGLKPGGTFEEYEKEIIRIYGDKNNPTIIFNLVKIDVNNPYDEIIGSIVYYITDVKNLEGILIKKNLFYVEGLYLNLDQKKII